MISWFLPNRHGKTREAYLEALAEATEAAYRTIVAAGPDPRLDCPDLALARHTPITDLTDAEFVKVAETHIAALHHAPADVRGE